jgi:hypothetical protein
MGQSDTTLYRVREGWPGTNAWLLLRTNVRQGPDRVYKPCAPTLALRLVSLQTTALPKLLDCSGTFRFARCAELLSGGCKGYDIFQIVHEMKYMH